MLLIHVTVIIQIILALVSLIKYKKLKKIKSINLYCHGRKSFEDIYIMSASYLWFNILFVYGAVLIKWGSRVSNIILKIENWCTIIISFVIAVLILSMTVAISVYMTTELKHFSPDDKVGEDILSIENKQLQKKAYRFYFEEVIIGALLDITVLIQSFYIHPVIGIAVIGVGFFLYYFGMADLLQYDNYNSPGFRDEFRKLKLSDKFFIKNILNYFVDKECHNKANDNIRENTSNIKKGLKYLFTNVKNML